MPTIIFDRRLAQSFDFILAGIVVLLISAGVLNLYSAALNIKTTGAEIYMKQITWGVIGIACMVLFALLDYRLIQRISYPLYALSLAILAITLLHGKAPTGATRWIAIGPISFQPSEMTKLSLILVLARYFDERWRPDGYVLRELIIPLLVTVVPFYLVIKQPDLGTALMILIIGFSMAFFARIRPGSLLILITGFFALVPLAWFMMKGYQKRRIVSFLNPMKDPQGSGYHQLQSKIAVGSGQFTGKGFLKGTQTQLHFLPEQHTDFAFSVWAEERGLIGGIILLAAFGYLLIKGLEIASHSRDRFGMLLSVGIVAHIFWQATINIGMVTGLLPVVGIPLPFISYGGSSLVTTCTEMGLLLSVGMRRHVF